MDCQLEAVVNAINEGYPDDLESPAEIFPLKHYHDVDDHKQIITAAINYFLKLQLEIIIASLFVKTESFRSKCEVLAIIQLSLSQGVFHCKYQNCNYIF